MLLLESNLKQKQKLDREELTAKLVTNIDITDTEFCLKGEGWEGKLRVGVSAVYRIGRLNLVSFVLNIGLQVIIWASMSLSVTCRD